MSRCRPSLEPLEHRWNPAVVPNVFNTGVDAGGNLLPDGAVDPHYRLVASADPNAVGPESYVVEQSPGNPIPPWYADGPVSKWIAPLAFQNVGNPPGQYVYETLVDLSGFVANTATLSGQSATDNFVLDVLVNGVSTGINEVANEFFSATPYTIGSSFFHSGVNQIRFVVFNASNAVNPTGFRNEMTVTADPAPPDDIAVGSDAGGTPIVQLYDSEGAPAGTADPFPGFTGGIRVAIDDFNGDGVPDLAAGTGPGIMARVKILDGTNEAVLFDVTPFDTFTGGVFVSTGDIDRDGFADLIITPDISGGPRIEVFRGGGFERIANFFGIDDANFRGGARTSAGDITGDGFAEIVVSAGFGGGPRISVYDGAALLEGKLVHPVNDFFAFEASLRNGVHLAVGDVDGDGIADVTFGAGPGGGPRVLIISGWILIDQGPAEALFLHGPNFFAGDQNNRGGVRVALKNLDGDELGDVVTGAGQTGGSGVAAYLGQSLAAHDATPAFEFSAFPGFAGGVFVG